MTVHPIWTGPMFWKEAVKTLKFSAPSLKIPPTGSPKPDLSFMNTAATPGPAHSVR